jgi:ABC-type uncharacterized transport system fused permease/ATPase subunit
MNTIAEKRKYMQLIQTSVGTMSVKNKLSWFRELYDRFASVRSEARKMDVTYVDSAIKKAIRVVRINHDKGKNAGDMKNLLRVINDMPSLHLIDSEFDTTDAVKKAKRIYLQQKYRL